MATYEEMIAKAKELYAAGDVEGAKRLARIAKDRAGQAAPQQVPLQPAISATDGNSAGDHAAGGYVDQIGRSIGDMAKAGAAGIGRGVAGMADLPSTVMNLYADLVAKGVNATGLASPEFAKDMRAGMVPNFFGGGSQVRDALSSITGGASDYKGETAVGKYAGTVGEFLPGAALFGGMSPSNLMTTGLLPGVASEAAGQATEGTAAEPYARVAGALLGGLAPSAARRGVARVVSPYGGADPERLKLAATLDDAGIPMTAGQRVGNEALRRKEELTTAGQAIGGAQREAFTRAALKSAGTDAARATPEVLKETAQRIGAVFDDVTRGVNVAPNADDLTALAAAVNTYKSLAPSAGQAPLVSEVLREATKAFRGENVIPAATVNVWRSGLSKLTASSDAATREAAQASLEAIDDMLSAAMISAGNVDDVARLATARTEWRNFLAIQKAATGAGEDAASGLISPAQLRSAVAQQGRAAYAQGRRGDLGELARAGSGVMSALKNSGTPAGMAARVGPGVMTAALGSTIGSSIAGPAGAAVGTLAGMAVPKISGALRMTRPMQAYLANQLMSPGKASVQGLLPPLISSAPNALLLPR
jgi:hypothetical protein